MRQYCWLFTGTALLYLLSITAVCWPCLALLGQNHLLYCQNLCVYECACLCVHACMHCTNPASSNKTHLPINPG